MTILKLWALCWFTMILLSGHVFAEDITRQRAEALILECDSERKRNIAPYKEEAINDCINNRKEDKSFCEEYYKNFGEGAGGGVNRGMFWGLPVCEKAFSAEKYFRKNPRKQVYSLP